jgi:hypothetical protein
MEGKTMTEEQQRIAIAEFCGWKDCHLSASWAAIIGTLYEVNGNQYARIPNYFSDKNAMQQAKEKLDIHERELFRRFLRFVVTEDQNNRDNAPEFATAGQEAKAILLALGKWIE